MTTGTVTTGGTQNGLNIVAAGVGAGTLNGLNIGGITAGAGVETGLNIGSGWDKAINANGIVLIGTSTNGYSFDPGASTGPVLTGTARPAKVITLSAEYAGASLFADGSATTNGSMTSGNTASSTTNFMNYYQWSSTQAALQDFTVAVRVTLPQDFDTWQTGACSGATCALEFNFNTGLTTTIDNAVSLQVNLQSSATAVCTIADTASGVANTWTKFGCTSTTLAGTGAWNAAGQTALVRFKLKARTTASALSQIGDITLRYFAKY